jgi:E3 ubiquitin-protein ligase MARCH6
MNDPQFDPAEANDKSPAEGDTCRICRSEASATEPLFYPCKCSGSIKFVHQDCLMEWLSHSNKKHCELCKTPFRFTKLYDSHMPHTLPLPIFVKRACLHTLNYLATWARAVTVALVWLVILPWCIRWSWRGLFWILDAGWARDPWLAKMAYAAQQHNNSTPAADSLVDDKEPFGLSLGKFLVNSLFYPLKPLSQSAIYSSSNPHSEASFVPLHSSLLSDVKAVNNLTSHVWLNRFILDVLEGDIITINVVVAFILIFLIREWVVQQQPIINAAAHIRDAEIQLDVAERAAQRLQDLEAAALEDETLRPNVERYRHIFEQPMSESETSEYDDTQFIGWYAMETLMDNAGVPHEFEGEDHDQFMEAFEEAGEELFAQLKLAEDSGISHADIAKNIWAILDNLGPTEKDLWREFLLQEGPTKYMLLNNLPEDKIEMSDDEYPEAGPAPPESDMESGTDDDLQDEQRRRPAMPPRDASSHAQRVIQSLEEPSDDLGSGDRNRMEHDGDSSSGSWQSITTSSNPESSGPARTPHSLLPATDDRQTGQSTTSANATTDQHSTDSQSAAPVVESNGSFANEDISHSLHEDTEPLSVATPFSIYEEQTVENPAEQQIAPRQDSIPQAVQIVEPRKGPISRLFDWFWADIVVEDDVNDPLAGIFEEEIVRDEADELPFVHVHGGELDHDLGNMQDPEVLQAAADAGLDAEAIEDAEDLEGVLELIGMQGPLAGLAQTAVFCGFLITATLWIAIGLPYFFGKIALLFLGDPITSMIMTPLRIVSMFADAIVDITVYVGGAATYFGSQILTQLLTLLVGSVFHKVGHGYVESLANRAHHAANGAGVRLAALFDGDGPLELGPLVKSNEARQSLLTLKAEAAHIVRFFANCVSGILYHLQNSTAPEILKAVTGGAARASQQTATTYSWIRTVLGEGLSETVKNGTFTFTVKHGDSALNPALAIWSNEDRCLTVLAGYILLAVTGTMYLLRKESLFSSPNLQTVEKTFADLLKQASGVLKVILIISIEMLAFPLYCGMLLDSALLPLFENATFASRLAFANRSPWLFVFLHWFIGTCYMFHFALFVSMCRRILRSGVLYFIRDPDDPTFHPVRDVLERSVTTQLRKIAFSGLVYGGLVIVCLGGAIWGTSRFGVFPVRWARPEADLEFPIDFLGYNLLAPVVATYLFPSKGMETIFGRWLKLCARTLRLSQFLFGERRKIEEGHLDGESWTSKLNPWKNQRAIVQSENFVKDGKYVRAPATDQVRIPRGDTVFLEVSETDRRVDGTNTSNGIHGRQPENFVQVYIPPWFRVRILTFISLLWMFAIAMGLGVTVLPMILGRLIMSVLAPQRVALNDLYNFAVGITTLGIVLQSLFNGRKAVERIKHTTSRQNLAAIGASVRKQAWRLVRSAYVYGFAVVIVPTLFALVLELYLILPLRTYMGPAAVTHKSVDITSDHTSGAQVTLANSTLTNFNESQVAQLAVSSHTFHILQDWTLGFIYGRVVLRLLLLSRTSRPAAAMRAITRDGVTNPNVKLATRAFVLPTLLLFSVVLICPALIASLLDVTNLVSASVRTKVYRYSYPICASQALGLWCTWELSEGLRRWRGSIKDEVYLIGERLHNLGERRPPEGSKSVVRRHS